MNDECHEEVCQEPSCAPGPRTIVRDRVAAALAMIWLGAAWIADIHVGVGLLGVAAIVFVSQLVRAARGLQVKRFWLAVGLVFASVGGASWGGLLLPDAPLLLVLGGVVLLLSLLVRGGLERSDAPTESTRHTS